jgi:hypothetical protein
MLRAQNISIGSNPNFLDDWKFVFEIIPQPQQDYPKKTTKLDQFRWSPSSFILFLIKTMG